MTGDRATFLWITPGSGQYVFVNLWGRPLGQPMSYASVDRLVRCLIINMSGDSGGIETLRVRQRRAKQDGAWGAPDAVRP